MRCPDTNYMLSAAFQHGQMPTMVYINKQHYGRKTVKRPLHKHSSICELILIYRGMGTYYVEGESYPLSEGSVVYYNQGDLHELVSGSDQEIGSFCIGITNLRLNGLARNCLAAAGEPFVRQAGPLFSALKSMCQQMFELEGAGTEGKLAAQLICSAFIILARRLGDGLQAPRGQEAGKQMAYRIKRYFDENFTQAITLQAAAEALGCSATYISHIFKKEIGVAPMLYVLQRRVGHAQTLLLSTDYSASHIATLVGYSNTNYFNTLFAKVVGMPPIRYREFYKEEMKGTMDQS